MMMKMILRTLTQNWKPKVVCLLLASVLWYLIQLNVTRTPARTEWPRPAATVR